MNAPTCPICGNAAELVAGKKLFPKLLGLKTTWFWRCEPCDAHVGCHPGSTTPLGMLATARTRNARTRAHRAFDSLWNPPQRTSTTFTRTKAYEWLSQALGIPPVLCHIGMFDEDTCERVIAAVRELQGLSAPASKRYPALPPPPEHFFGS